MFLVLQLTQIILKAQALGFHLKLTHIYILIAQSKFKTWLNQNIPLRNNKINANLPNLASSPLKYIPSYILSILNLKTIAFKSKDKTPK